MPEEKEAKYLFDRLFSLPGLRIFSPFWCKNRELLLYLFFGVLTTAISWGSFYLFYYPLCINELLANILSWIAAVLFAFFTNRIWVFQSKEQTCFSEIWRFFAGRLATLGIEEGLIFLFVTKLSFHAMLIKILCSILILLLNYLFSKFFVFVKKK